MPQRSDRVASPPLARRREPIQARARATVTLLLDTAAALLDEVGVDGFTTNLLAARAGVRIRTVYRYFPNKLALITAVAERLAAAESRHVDGFAAAADAGLSPAEAVARVLDGYLAGARAQPGFLAIRKAMRAVPALQAIERRANQALVRQLADALDRRGLGLAPARRRAIAAVLVESVAAVLDLALASPPAEATRLIAELRHMHECYLAGVVGGGTDPA
jgi:AcrR family transcriptional regulator